MLMRLSAEARNRSVDIIAEAIDSGGSPGRLAIYAAPIALSTDDPCDAKLLGVLTFSFPCAPLAIDGALVFAPISEEKSARASGRAEWARLSAADGRAIVDIDVSRIGGNGVIQFDREEIQKGRPISVSSFVLRAA